MGGRTGSIFRGLRYLAIRFNLIPGVYFNLLPSFGSEIAVGLSDHDNLVVVLACIVNELENMRQKSGVCDDGVRPVHLKNSREQLRGAQGNGGNGLLGECEITDKEF